MKINSNNTRIFNPDNTNNNDIKDKKTSNSEDAPKSSSLQDRVEISGNTSSRQANTNRVTSAYSLHINTSEDTSAPVLTNVSQEASVSAERIEEIKEKVSQGFYDTDDVLNSVSKMMVNDVKKIDHNI